MNAPAPNMKKGNLFILSAPSGAGKSTLCKAVLKQYNDILYSISHTTRKPRQDEQDGVDYYFIPEDDFLEKINHGKWAEWAEVHGNYYGTSADFIDKQKSSGRDILLDIDVQGARQILERYPDSITIFIMPPSLDALKQRMQSRGMDSEDIIDGRMANAEKEMTQKNQYRHVIVNDTLADAVAEILAVIGKYRK